MVHTRNFVVELFNEPTLNIIFSGLSLKLHSSRVRPVNLLPSLELIWIDDMNIKVRIISPGSVYITMRTWRNIKGNVNVILCDPPFKEGHRWFTTTLLPKHDDLSKYFFLEMTHSFLKHSRAKKLLRYFRLKDQKIQLCLTDLSLTDGLSKKYIDNSLDFSCHLKDIIWIL